MIHPRMFCTTEFLWPSFCFSWDLAYRQSNIANTESFSQVLVSSSASCELISFHSQRTHRLVASIEPESVLHQPFGTLVNYIICAPLGQGGNVLWSFLAPMLVQLENHRTEADSEARGWGKRGLEQQGFFYWLLSTAFRESLSHVCWA